MPEEAQEALRELRSAWKVQEQGEHRPAIVDTRQRLGDWEVDTITSDNGKEFAEHERIAADLQTRVFFAHIYSSWERATNENTNGLIRQYFPKSCSFATISQEEIDFVKERLNNRPRKSLGFKPPNQVFFNHSPVVALSS